MSVVSNIKLITSGTESTYEIADASARESLLILEPGATASDVGKYLKVKTIDSGKATSYEFDYPSVPSAYTSNPSANGTASPGSSSNYSRGDHVHPTDTTRAAATAVPTQASINSTGLITFKNSSGTSLFTLQLPLYAGGVS